MPHPIHIIKASLSIYRFLCVNAFIFTSGVILIGLVHMCNKAFICCACFTIAILLQSNVRNVTVDTANST